MLWLTLAGTEGEKWKQVEGRVKKRRAIGSEMGREEPDIRIG